MSSYVAFLRAINVGGRNLVAMPALADCFRGAGYTSVRTHAQSGNVLFVGDATSGERLEAALDETLLRGLGFPVPAVVRSRDELAETVASAPAEHGSAELRSDVFFLKWPLTVEAIMAQLPALREGVDSIAPGPRALYFSRVANEASKTRITRLMSMPVFQQITVRTWRTTLRLLELLDSGK